VFLAHLNSVSEKAAIGEQGVAKVTRGRVGVVTLDALDLVLAAEDQADGLVQ
jgi:hypothetical protein